MTISVKMMMTSYLYSGMAVQRRVQKDFFLIAVDDEVADASVFIAASVCCRSSSLEALLLLFIIIGRRFE